MGGLGSRGLLHVGGHGLAPFAVRQEPGQRLSQRIHHLAVGHQHSAVPVGQAAGVVGLVVFRDVRRGDEDGGFADEGELGDTAASYENEIEGILRDAGERVKRFQAAAQHSADEKLIADKVREVELKYEAQKQRALKEIEEFKPDFKAGGVGGSEGGASAGGFFDDEEAAPVDPVPHASLQRICGPCASPP